MTDRRSLVGLVTGALACTALFLLRVRADLLVRISRYSYTIYLFHPFPLAAIVKLDLPDKGEIVAFGITAGILGPTALHRIADRTDITRLLLLGLPARGGPAPTPLGTHPRRSTGAALREPGGADDENSGRAVPPVG